MDRREPLRAWTARTRPDLPTLLAVFRAIAIELAENHERGTERAAFDVEIGDAGSVKVVGGEDPADDQRAFCAALFEAVVGRAPSGAPRWPNAQPAWLGHVVMRGLSPAASEQWPSMSAVVEALEAGQRGHGHRWLWLAGVLAAGLLVVVLSSGESNCDAPRTETGHRDLDAWASAWADEHHAACTNDRSRVLACLDRVRHRFETLAAAVDDPQVQARLEAAAGSLPPPSACADPKLLAAEPPPPRDPAEARAATAIEADLERARASASLGRLDSADDLARQALGRAQHLDHPPLIGRALWTVGALEARRGRPDAGVAKMERAYATLEGAGATRAAGKAALSIASSLADLGRDPAVIGRWADRAAAAFDAHGSTEYERELLARVRVLR